MAHLNFCLLLATCLLFAILQGAEIKAPNAKLAMEAVNPSNDEEYTGTLRMVTVVTRHGNRAPESTYPNDPHKNDTMAPFGWGQLTHEGRVNQYNQGLYLRNRYDKFLGSTYSPKKFTLRTTDVDRAKMSGLLEAAAIWRPNQLQSFKNDLPWQPTSLYYENRKLDELLLIWATCPAYIKESERVKSLPEFAKINEENKDLYKELESLTGMKFESPEDILDLQGTLTAEDGMNLTLPEWTKNYYPEKLNPLASLSLEMNVYSDLQKRLVGGPLVEKIIATALAKRQQQDTNKSDPLKMAMYVGHDSTLTNLLVALGVWDKQVIDYNQMVIAELHEDQEGWNIQLFQRTPKAHEAIPLTIPGCSTVCPLDKFIKVMKPVTYGEWKELCKVDDANYTPPPPPPA